MLSRSLVQDFFTQDQAERRCGEERCAKRFVRRERIGNFEDAGFGALAIRFRRFVFPYALVQLPRRGINLPGRNENLKFVNDRECLLNRFPRALQIAVSDGYSRLQIPSEASCAIILQAQCMKNFVWTSRSRTCLKYSSA